MNSDNETYFDRFGAVYISKKKKVHSWKNIITKYYRVQEYN